MVKRKKHDGSRSAFDNPLAAARSGKATTTKTNTNTKTPKNEGAIAADTSDWIEFETPGNQKSNKTKLRNDKHASKMSKKAEQIWHRRSGAGFHLFVDYYLGQPDGIVLVSSNSNDKSTLAEEQQQHHLPTASALTMAPPNGGGGQSRAALRRKKKKRKTATTVAGAGVTASEPLSSPSPPLAIPNSYQNHQLLHSGRLLEILSSKTKTKTKSPANTKNDPSTTTRSHSASFRDFVTALSKPLPLTFRFRRYETPATNSNNKAKDDGDDNDDGIVLVPSYEQRRRRIQKIKGLKQILQGKTLARANVKPVPFDPDYIYQAMAPPQLLRSEGTGRSSHQHPFPVDKASLKHTCPQLKEFLNDHTNDGSIARQELGSMLPVWLLDRVGAFSSFSRSNNNNKSRSLLRVLDTCASPGSKTLQVAELVSATKGGRVRANDVNANRLESLKEALARSGFFGSDDKHDSNDSGDDDDDGQHAASIESLVRFSNVDASRYPIPKSEAKKYPIILCDVPCSGDGTVRKDVHVIPNWTPGISNALHSLQVKILARALRCVAIDGIVSYSTCSLNPIEDEAVVLAALEEMEPNNTTKSKNNEGKNNLRFELIQVSNNQLNGLIMRNGVCSWRVADFDPRRVPSSSSNTNNNDGKAECSPRGDADDNDDDDDDNSVGGTNDDDDDAKDDEEKPAQLQWYDSYRNALDGGMEGALESMWPPPQALAEKNHETEPFSSASSFVPQLNRCLRLLPQDQDTGGFFVALVRRTK